MSLSGLSAVQCVNVWNYSKSLLDCIITAVLWRVERSSQDYIILQCNVTEFSHLWDPLVVLSDRDLVLWAPRGSPLSFAVLSDRDLVLWAPQGSPLWIAADCFLFYMWCWASLSFCSFIGCTIFFLNFLQLLAQVPPSSFISNYSSINLCVF
jgi:hypothetical protein